MKLQRCEGVVVYTEDKLYLESVNGLHGCLKKACENMQCKEIGRVKKLSAKADKEKNCMDV